MPAPAGISRAKRSVNCTHTHNPRMHSPNQQAMASTRKVCFLVRSCADATRTHAFDMNLRLAADLFDTVFDQLLEGTLTDKVIIELDENNWSSVTTEKLAHFCKICELVRDQDSDVETYVDEHFDVAPLMMKLLHALRLKPHFWQTRYYCLGTELFANKNKTFLTLAVYNEIDDEIILEVTKDALFRVATMPNGRWHVLVVPNDDCTPPVSVILEFAGHDTTMDFLKNVRHAAGRTMQLAYAAGEEGDDLFNNMLYFATRNAAHIQLSEDRGAFLAMLSREEAQLFEANQHISLMPVVQLDNACAAAMPIAVKSMRIGESSCAPWIFINDDVQI